jgi:hypothetical protein
MSPGAWAGRWTRGGCRRTSSPAGGCRSRGPRVRRLRIEPRAAAPSPAAVSSVATYTRCRALFVCLGVPPSLSLSLSSPGRPRDRARRGRRRPGCVQAAGARAVSPCRAGWPWVVPRLGEGQRTRSSLCWPPPERSVDAQLPSAQDVTPAAGIHHCRPHLGSGSLDAARLRRRLSGRRWGVMPQQPSSGRQRPSLH